MSFADNLICLRKKNKITQEDLAAALDVSRQSVSKWETGEAYPETDKLIAICDKFGVTMDDLVRGNVCTEGATIGGEQPAKAEESVADDGAHTPAHEHRKQTRGSKAATFLSSFTMSICAVIYICMGAIFGLWHPGWLIFFAGCIVCVWSGSLSDPAKQNHSLKHKIGSAICGSAMVAATGVYLLMGFLWNLWHPGWVIFIAAVVLTSIVGATMCKD